MFDMKDDYIVGAFLYPNYKQLREANSSQIADSHSTCRLFVQGDQSSLNIIEENYEPPTKKTKSFYQH